MYTLCMYIVHIASCAQLSPGTAMRARASCAISFDSLLLHGRSAGAYISPGPPQGAITKGYHRRIGNQYKCPPLTAGAFVLKTTTLL